MSRILIWMRILQSGEYDIFSKTDYKVLEKHVLTEYGGVCPNLGNRLWFQAIISEISTSENTIEYLKQEIDWDEINSSYDMIIAPMANVFHVGFKDLLARLANNYRKIKIPIYVIACGVQAPSYDCINDIIDEIGDVSKEFIKAVYQTGGEFALRGYFSKEFFSRLGFNSACVTGCPSLFQSGRKPPMLRIDEHQRGKKLKPILNGDLRTMAPLLKTIPEAVFIDQGAFFLHLYGEGEVTSQYVNDLVKAFGLTATEMLADGRVKLIPDLSEWYSYVINGGYNFSFGSRIHGNIMSILCGVPSLLKVIDSRTQEIAEFFEIPYIKGTAIDDLSHLYQKADYTGFNKSFESKYDAFEDFLKKHGIVSQINSNNTYLKTIKDTGEVFYDESRLGHIKSVTDANRIKLTALDLLLQVKRRITK